MKIKPRVLPLLVLLLVGQSSMQAAHAEKNTAEKNTTPLHGNATKQDEAKSKPEQSKESKPADPTAEREPTEHELRWAQCMMIARRAMLAGKVKEATELLDLAFEETKNFPPKDFKTGITLWEMGQLHKDKGEYPAGEVKVKEALEILKEQSERRPMEYAAALNSLAGIQKDLGKYTEAEETYGKVIAIVEKSPHDPEKLALATSLDNLGVLYQKQKHYHKAIEIQTRVLQIYDKSTKVQARDRAITLNNLAESYQHVGESEKARGMYVEAIDLMEKSYGKMHPSVATFKDNLSAILKAEGKLKEAEKLELEVVEIYRKALGDDHPDLGIALHNMAGLYIRQDNRAKAIEYEKQALAIFEKALGKSHPLSQESQQALKIMESPDRELPPLKVPR